VGVNALAISTTVAHDGHVTRPRHPERSERLPAAVAGVHDVGEDDAIVWVEPAMAERVDIERVHTKPYLDRIESFCASGGGSLDPDTDASPNSWNTARRAAGAGLAALDKLRNGEAEAGLVLVRPPGHHALADRSMGFCLLNNIAIAAASLTARGERVVIVDWDVHHGNGTQAMFWNDPNVLFVSSQLSPHWPFTGAVTETGGADAPGLTINLPFPEGATGDVFLKAYDDVVAPAVDRFRPTWVLVW
jgi:acetoin utilization deacetylase AcuC-like enzyme